MKKLLLACAVAVMTATGCQTKGHSPKPAVRVTQQKNPQPGMTKDEVIALYGTTENKKTTSDGEVWVYTLKPGQAMIPWNWTYAHHPKIRTIYFGPDGKVTNWSYSR